MSSIIKYKGNTIATLNTNISKTLKTSGKYCEADILVENTQDGGITPTGTINISQNGVVDVTNYASANVNVSGGGGGTTVISNGVYFMDYDGSIIEEWDATNVASKTELPNNPTHTGLTAQGWNWSLSNIKTYMQKYPKANIYVGQKYKTTSNLTEIDVSITKITGKTITMNMVGNKNWGDGTTDNLTTHTYEDYGDYTITCDGTSIPSGSTTAGGMFDSSSSNINRYWCTAIRLSSSVTSIGAHAFRYCYSLINIIIPDSVTSIGAQAFRNCYSLINIIIPDSVTSIGASAFNSCYSLANIIIPDSVTSIGTSAFDNCYSLANIIILDSVTSIGASAFNNCYSLTEYDFSSITAIPTLVNSNAFNSINGICKMVISDELYDDWIASTNWSDYADYIYKASEVV